jgi:hypothetical protein
MKKRNFLLGAGIAAACTAAWPLERRRLHPTPDTMPVLTVFGRISRSNRGRVDKVHDQLLKRHAVTFDRAFTYTLADLLELPALPIVPTLEYDARPHVLRGPTLVNVLLAAGVDTEAALQVGIRALDGYRVMLPMAQVRERTLILATHLDDKPLSIGGLGPLWAVFNPVSVPSLRDKPLTERYAECPWGTYCIEVAG